MAFIGDVHGQLQALQSLISILRSDGVETIVLLGDYVNRGPDSAGVIQYLSELTAGGGVLCLRGNHEEALLRCLQSGDVRPLLRMSGAPTIRSYVGGNIGPDVFGEFRRTVPDGHVAFLQSLPLTYSDPEFVASHLPSPFDGRFVISAHEYVGSSPDVDEYSARIDTGCGSADGVLSAFLWPSRRIHRVDMTGAPV